ncbi:hypothetical protein F1C16_06115 [Hymenobacter sp. NBH84]|uniref:hypothetical protein n=1 Tax=Hymenobacter sp. NBH84 TaxID=2596915 RepID=UPI0016294BB9|nr:hypothetical protein [Hymenobacter sp. NBH84]QNE39160.1 hypothetical protein F1C16_06115 [Hymenobacter sp. NBH84]
MKNYVFLAALLIALGLILYLFRQLTATEEALKLAEKRFADCEQVTFQLQMQNRGVAPRGRQDVTRDTLQ